MKLGVFSFNTEYSIRADELAIAAEERGFDSVWFPEHTHSPASRESPWPGNGDLPKEYVHMSDPLVSAGAAAVVTKKIKIGTGICLVVQHEPLALAKAPKPNMEEKTAIPGTPNTWRIPRKIGACGFSLYGFITKRRPALSTATVHY